MTKIAGVPSRSANNTGILRLEPATADVSEAEVSEATFPTPGRALSLTMLRKGAESDARRPSSSDFWRGPFVRRRSMLPDRSDPRFRACWNNALRH